MARVEAKCSFCGTKSGAELAGLGGFAPSLLINDSVDLACEHAAEFRNGTIFFSTVIFIDGDEIDTVPCEPVM